MHGAGTTGSAGYSGLPCAMGYGLYALSSGTGSLAPVARALVKARDLGISTGMPGPHDFAVHTRSLVQRDTCGHRVPRSTSVTTRTPLKSNRDAPTKSQFLQKRKRNIFDEQRRSGDVLECARKLCFSAQEVLAACPATGSGAMAQIARTDLPDKPVPKVVSLLPGVAACGTRNVPVSDVTRLDPRSRALCSLARDDG